MRVSTYYVVPWCFIKDLFRVSRNFCVQYLTPHVYVLRVSPFFCSLLHFPAKLHSVTMWPKAILLYKPKVFLSSQRVEFKDACIVCVGLDCLFIYGLHQVKKKWRNCRLCTNTSEYQRTWLVQVQAVLRLHGSLTTQFSK